MFVDITDDAEVDLEEIGDLIAHKGSPKRAETFVKELELELEQACTTLADTPLLFPRIPRYEERGIRHRVHGNYPIFYRVVEVDDRIDVLRTLNSRRDYPRSCSHSLPGAARFAPSAPFLLLPPACI